MCTLYKKRRVEFNQSLRNCYRGADWQYSFVFVKRPVYLASFISSIANFQIDGSVEYNSGLLKFDVVRKPVNEMAYKLI